MTDKQIKAQHTATVKAQKETSDNEFKRGARVKALETAQYLYPKISSVVSVSTKQEKYDVIKEAEKIYQWLIKVLK